MVLGLLNQTGHGYGVCSSGFLADVIMIRLDMLLVQMNWGLLHQAGHVFGFLSARCN